jgi:hypothetical protein
MKTPGSPSCSPGIVNKADCVLLLDRDEAEIVTAPIPREDRSPAPKCTMARATVSGDYPWLQHEKIPSTEPDHREKENELGN